MRTGAQRSRSRWALYRTRVASRRSSACVSCLPPFVAGDPDVTDDPPRNEQPCGQAGGRARAVRGQACQDEGGDEDGNPAGGGEGGKVQAVLGALFAPPRDEGVTRTPAPGSGGQEAAPGERAAADARRGRCAFPRGFGARGYG